MGQSRWVWGSSPAEGRGQHPTGPPASGGGKSGCQGQLCGLRPWGAQQDVAPPGDGVGDAGLELSTPELGDFCAVFIFFTHAGMSQRSHPWLQLGATSGGGPCATSAPPLQMGGGTEHDREALRGGNLALRAAQTPLLAFGKLQRCKC